MHLRELVLENTGPVSSLNVELLSEDAGSPKPVVFVGANGSGKTIVLSYIADALYEFAKNVVEDYAPGATPFSSRYLRYVKGQSIQSGKTLSLALMDFVDGERHMKYREKCGSLNRELVARPFRERFTEVWNWDEKPDGEAKKVSRDVAAVREVYEKGTYLFFPASRREAPDWLNAAGLPLHPSATPTGRIKGHLEKPLWVESCAPENMAWILDVLVDSLVDPGALDRYRANQLHAQRCVTRPPQSPEDVDTQNRLVMSRARSNLETLLRAVLDDPICSLLLNLRQLSASRISIRKGDGTVVPSLDALPTGQAVLLNLFVTIIRYADRTQLNHSIDLNQITGMVLIDEVDAHLHTRLQHQQLPKLVLPRVQFVMTSHSPAFLLGMNEEFTSDGFDIIEMPDGTRITTERFAEFKTALDYYAKTKAFEVHALDLVAKAEKPLVFTEGDHDVTFIRTALELLEEADLLHGLEIRYAGTPTPEGPKGSGTNGLNDLKKALEKNPILIRKAVLLLYDPEVKKKPEEHHRLWIRAMPKNENDAKARTGIENLFPRHLFEARFFQLRESRNAFDEPETKTEFRKKEFCRWICEDRRNRNDFVNFAPVITILREFFTMSKGWSTKP